MHLSVCVRAAVISAVLVVVCGTRVHAQLFENVGTRANGMAGAFVAVADDATSTWWNPAGIATGGLASAVFDHGRTTDPGTVIAGAPAIRAGMNAFAAVFPSLGVSYYRLRISAIRPQTSTAAGPADRQDSEAVAMGVQSVALNQFGTTVGQSIGSHFVLGSTLKLVRAGAASGSVAPDADALDAADDLPIDLSTQGDLDLGVMASFAHARFGVAVKNIREPNFGTDASPLVLERQARAGIAVLAAKAGVIDGLTLSADADLTRTSTVLGDVRHVAAGGEVWMLKRHLGLRGGVSMNTVNEKRTAYSGGASVAAYTGLYVDVFRTFGSDTSIEGWGTALRLAF
jgi:F plasmid transfer operon protein TraF